MGKRGPEPIQIDIEEFNKLLSYQCTQKEIADFYGIDITTLENWCERTLGVKLSVVWDKRRSFGKVRLRKAQFDIVERGGPGAATMAIYLDKKIFPDERVDLPPAPIPPTGDTLKIASGLLLFAEFCQKAGYFVPFPKQEEMRAFGMELTETRLLLGARGYGKTDFVTIMGVAYDVYKAWKSGADMSEHTTLIITKAKPRAKAIIEEIGNALEKNGIPLEKFNATEIRVQGLVGQDHSVEAITIKTSMRGRHPKRIVMDDPVTDEDVSEAMRDTVKRKYDEAYKLCQNILIIGQPAHFDDLYARVRDQIKTLCVPHGQIPELDVDLDAMLKAMVDKNSIEMSYHLRVPKDSSSIFSGIKYVDKFPNGGSIAFIDPSDGGDYTAVAIGKGYFDGIAIQGHCWKKAWYHCLDELVPILVARGVTKLCFETNMTGEQPVFQLRELLGPKGISVVGRRSDSNKHAIIQAAGSYSHLIYLSKESDPTYTDLVIKYEYKAKFDDPPDSLARLLEWLGLIRGKK